MRLVLTVLVIGIAAQIARLSGQSAVADMLATGYLAAATLDAIRFSARLQA